MVYAFRHEKLILEGAGAASIALLLKIAPEKLGDNIALICSGDNVDPNKILQLIEE